MPQRPMIPMEVACIKIRLKPDSLETVRAWASRMTAEMNEVKKLLKNEGMSLESVFLEQGSEGDFLIYYVRSPDLKKTVEICRASQHPIDIYHREVMRQIEAGSIQLECLLDASNE